MDLATILNQHHSPKDRLGYAQVYASLLSHRRADPLTILEIGAHSGSLLAWAEYFPAAQVIGLDPDFISGAAHPRIQIIQCTPTASESVAEFHHRHGSLKCDLIIDAGGSDSLRILRHFYSYLKPEGFYLIEGIEPGSQLQTCPSLIGCMCEHDSYFFAGLKASLGVIHKHQLVSQRTSY